MFFILIFFFFAARSMIQAPEMLPVPALSSGLFRPANGADVIDVDVLPLQNRTTM